MRALDQPIRDTEEIRKAMALLQEKSAHLMADGCAESQKLHFTSLIAGQRKLTLFLTYSDQRAGELAREYSFYHRGAAAFPAKDLIFYQADLRGREIERERMLCLRRLLEGKPAVVFTTFPALLTPQIPLRYLKEYVFSFEKRGRCEPAEVSARLTAMGYEKTDQAENPGQYAIRGDIIDIYDLTSDNPYRIELWGDEIDSIRSFDAQSQRSIENLEMVTIFPAREMILSKVRLADGLSRMEAECERVCRTLEEQDHHQEAKRLSDGIGEICEAARQWGETDRLESYIHYFYPQTDSFLSLFPPEDTLLVFDEPTHIEEQIHAVILEFRENMIQRAQKGYNLPGQMEFLSEPEPVLEKMREYRRLGLSQLAQKNGIFETDRILSLHVRGIAPYNRSFDKLTQDLKKFRAEHYRIILFSPSRTRARHLAEELGDQGITAFYSENPDRLLKEGEIMTYYGPVRHGFVYPQAKFMVIAESDIFGGRQRRKRKAPKQEGEKIRSYEDLHVGDYVVHETHGIGIYRGVEKVEIDRIAKDYLKIEYKDGGTLYVLPTEMDVLQKYASADAKKPKINKLGTQEWTNTRKKVEKAVSEIADDLVALYAARQQKSGHVFGEDTVWQQEFEELFPFEETDDQLRAIEETKKDMQSEKIMDRLICGDVGYGKTEIAIRAAFKAVQDSMQVAVLVPTTILAQQHFNTFTERMGNYPVKIEMLSRFRTAAEQKKTLKRLENGETDIVIGTHSQAF